MARNYVQPGRTISLTAPTGGTTTGVGVLVGSYFGVALDTKSAGAAVEVAIEGVFDLAKTSAQSWAEGDRIFWDNANKRADNVATAGFKLIGVAAATAANPSSTGRVRLNGTGVAFDIATRPAPVSKSDAGPVTLTAAEILAGTIVADPNGAGRTYTLPTAALLVAAIPGARVGDTVDVLIVNGADAAEAITLQAGTGGAFDANQTASSRVIAQNAQKTVRIRLTNVTASSEAYVVYA